MGQTASWPFKMEMEMIREMHADQLLSLMSVQIMFINETLLVRSSLSTAWNQTLSQICVTVPAGDAHRCLGQHLARQWSSSSALLPRISLSTLFVTLNLLI